MIVETSGRPPRHRGWVERSSLSAARRSGRPPSPTIRAWPITGRRSAWTATPPGPPRSLSASRSRCPELTRADLLLVSWVMAAAQQGQGRPRAKEKAAPRQRRAQGEGDLIASGVKPCPKDL